MTHATVLPPPHTLPPGVSARGTPNIALIGMEGSGKTVLATTLAKRLSTIDGRGVFLNPQGVKTLKYVEKVWQTLQSGEWPPSTPPGELFELRWKFQIVGEMECDVRLVDVAGQDLRLLFGDEMIQELQALPANLRAVADYCRSADIILFVINLKDYIGEGNAERRTSNEAAIKSAMDLLTSDGRRRRVCLVLTQIDQYRDLAEEKGGWLELTAEAVPYVFGAHVKSHHVAVYPVSAVADTRVVVETDGTPRRVPSEGFRSEGLDEIVAWLTTQVREAKPELDQEAEQAALAAQPTPAPAVVHKKSSWGRYLGAFAAVVVVILMMRGCVPGCSGDGPGKNTPDPVVDKPTSPIPKWIEFQTKEDPGVFDDGVIVYGMIQNVGAQGTIRITAWVDENGSTVETQNQDFYLGRGKTAYFQFQMDKIHSLQNDWKADATASVH